MGRYDALTRLDTKPLPSPPQQASNTPSATPQPKPLPASPQKHKPSAPQAEGYHDTVIPRHHETVIPSNRDTTTPMTQEEVFEAVRKSVKQIGKEAATHRFTLAEKQMLADIEYTYQRQGIRTSENEITRIAINYFVEDYRRNGATSLLAKVLKRLNS